MKFFAFSKAIVLSFIVFLSFTMHGQNVSFSFANPAQTFDGTDSIFEVDVMIASQDAAGAFKLSSGLLYFNFNTTTLGTDLVFNSRVAAFYEDPAYLLDLKDNSAGVIGVYSSPVLNDNTPMRFAVAWQQDRAEACISAIIDDTPTALFRLQVKYLAGMSGMSTDLCFETGSVFTDQTYTACGPTGACAFQSADCAGEPGTRIFDDIFDCTIAVANADPATQDDTASIIEDTPTIVDVLSNDSDAEGPLDPCNVTILSPPTNGTVAIGAAPGCEITFTPAANYEGADSFTYEVCDAGGACGSGSVAITVTGVNDAPMSMDDSATTMEDIPVSISPTTNDSDPEDGTLDPCSITIMTPPTNGTAVLGAAPLCDIVYTPNPDYCADPCAPGTPVWADALAIFSSSGCTASNCHGGGASGLTLTTYSGFTAGGNQCGSSITTGSLLTDIISVGSTSCGGDGNIPAMNNFTGGAVDATELALLQAWIDAGARESCDGDSFVYQICDSEGLCTQATVSIAVTCVNDNPTIQPDTPTVLEDTPTILDPTANDTDSEDGTLDPCNLTIVTPPVNGTLVIGAAPACELTYTPNPDFDGTDSFVYQVCDSGGACGTGVTTVSVTGANDGPIAVADASATDEDTPVSVDFAANDSDVEDGTLDPCGATITVQPTNGTVVLGAVPLCDAVYTPNADFSGSDSFVYEICDTGGLCATAIVSMTINAVNDLPVVVEDTPTVDEDTPTVIMVTANDSDLEDGNLSPCAVSIISQPTNGTLVLGTTPPCNLTYTPNPDYSGPDSFVYEVCDFSNGCGTAAVNITVAPANDAPVAVDDDATTDEDMEVNIPASANDSDIDDGLNLTSLTVLTVPANGSAAANPDGTIDYEPNPDFCGSDSFSYQICDMGGLCATANISVTVNCINDIPVAVNDSETTLENEPIVVDVLDNDTDAEDATLDPCNVTILVNPANGTVVLGAAPDCEATYTPNLDYNGTDSFQYQVCDSNNACATAVASIVIQAVDPPFASEDDMATVDEDGSVVVDVLTNDIDPANPVTLDPCAVTIAVPPTTGTVSFGPAPDCELTYTPDPNFDEADSFVYQICFNTDCDQATVIVEVTPINDPIVPGDDSANTMEDTPVTIPVLANDSDPDGNLDPSTLVLATTPPNGEAVINVDGTITYTPDSDFSGTDSFNYTICDDAGSCDQATVTIVVSPVNDAPVAENDNAGTSDVTPIVIDVLANDSDADGNIEPCVTIATPPASGSVVVGPVPGCEVTYSPTQGFAGTDTFVYEVCDNQGLCATAIVSVVVSISDFITASDDTESTDEDVATDIAILANDVSSSAIDPCAVTITTPPANGTVTFGAAPMCMLNYAPNADFNGTDSFEYEICNPANAECDQAVVTITVVSVNDDPIAVADAANTQAETLVNIPLVGNDSDPDGMLDNSSLTVLTNPAGGTVLVNTDGSVDYTPNAGFSGTDTFNYVICDDGIPTACASAIVTVTVSAAPNVAPVAVDDTMMTQEDMAVIVPVTANDSDSDGMLDLTSLSVTAPPSNGTAAANTDGTVTYTPNTGFTGMDTFSYEICDNGMPALCDNAVVTVTVNAAPNIAPVAVDDAMMTQVDMPVIVPVLANDSDSDGMLDLTSLSVTAPAANGTAAANTDGTVTYTPNTGFTGTDTFSYEICDDGMPVLCDNAVVTVVVTTAPNVAPVAADDTMMTQEDMAVVVPVTANDSDADGMLDLASLSVTTPPANGTATANTDGTVTYTPNTGFTGMDTFSYEVCDNGNPALCDNAVVTITVNAAANVAPVAVDDQDTTVEDTPVTSSVLANDSDPDGMLDMTSLTVSIAPANATAVVNPGGTITYTPNPNFSGTDTYEYEICDNGTPVLCDNAIVEITVTTSNDPPSIVDDAATTTQDTPVTIDVNSNDSDIQDGTLDPCTVNVILAPANGSTALAAAPGCGVVYTPNTGFSGTDTFSYENCDDDGNCDNAVVTVTVTPVAPLVANDDQFVTPIDATIMGNVLANDTGVVGGETLTITTGTTNGTVTLNPDGTFTYIPNAGYEGPDQFNYEVCNATTCDNAIAFITVSSTAAIPTMSEWGLMILMLLLLTFGTLQIQQMKPMLAGAPTGSFSTNKQGSKMPFELDIFKQVLGFIALIAILGLVVSFGIFGFITPVDFVGTILTTFIGSYLVHIWIMFYNE